MNIQNQINELLKQYGSHEKLFFAHLLITTLQANQIFILLDSFEKSKQYAENLILSEQSQVKPFFKSITKSSKKEIIQKLNSLIEQHVQLLKCSTIDECIILLSAAKGLEQISDFKGYASLKKDLLTSGLHTLGNHTHAIECIGRKKEIENINAVLHRSFKNNVLIVGKSGMGKTALVYSLDSHIPDFEVIQTNTIKDSVLESFVYIHDSNKQKNTVFVIDEITAFENKIIQTLFEKNQIVATTTESGFGAFTAKSAHLASRFEIIRLDEPSKEDLKLIFLYHMHELSQKYKVRFEDTVVEELFTLGKIFLPDIAQPANGISLLQETAYAAHQSQQTLIQVADLKKLVAQKQNIPLASLDELEKQDLRALPSKILGRIKGQDATVKKVSDAIIRSRMGFKKPNKPVASFLFIGPSGVGKTELAKAVAYELFGSEDAMVRLDMSEFGEAHMVQRLIGAPPGYVGFEEGGQLTNPIKQKPYSLVLLDEIEKAHPRIFDIFLQVLDDGRLTDGKGDKVDFTNTIITATSNAGIEDILDLIEEGKSKEEIEVQVREIIQDHFRIEFLNRFDEIIIFNPLSSDALAEIAKNHIAKLAQELAKTHITLDVSTDFIESLVHTAADPRYGARGLNRLIQEKIETVLAEKLLHGHVQPGDTLRF